VGVMGEVMTSRDGCRPRGEDLEGVEASAAICSTAGGLVFFQRIGER